MTMYEASLIAGFQPYTCYRYKKDIRTKKDRADARLRKLFKAEG